MKKLIIVVMTLGTLSGFSQINVDSLRLEIGKLKLDIVQMQGDYEEFYFQGEKWINQRALSRTTFTSGLLLWGTGALIGSGYRRSHFRYTLGDGLAWAGIGCVVFSIIKFYTIDKHLRKGIKHL